MKFWQNVSGDQSTSRSNYLWPMGLKKALFAAVEHGHFDKAKTILESTEVDVNSINNDGLSPLDVAVLNNNRPLATMLIVYGAQEGNRFKSPESLSSHLAFLLSEAERKVRELGGSATNSGTDVLQNHNLSGCSVNSDDRQLTVWVRRAQTLRKMLRGFDQTKLPDVPFTVTIDVTGTNCVTARFLATETHELPICTKFKLQWSTKEEFSTICGEREILDTKQRECRIEGLQQGQRYYFRAAFGNLKGYGRYCVTTPIHVTPNSWMDVDGRAPRFGGRLQQLNNLLTDVRGPEYAQEAPLVQRRNLKKKTTINKLLFAATSKFQKNLRRGIFLCCLLYHEDKVLVTNEEFLPVIEVDEIYPNCIYNDFHWLMKIACTWEDVKLLRQDMDKSNLSSTNHFRIKLLQASAQMQDALGTMDLGQFYHKPIRDIQGTLVLSVVNCVQSSKEVSMPNCKWLPISKVTKKVVVHEDSNVADMLMASIRDQITYHQLSSIKLSKGLYLGYLKMQSSMDSIQIVVPSKSPNVLPHCKIRDNSHVSVEEWECLRRVPQVQSTHELQGTEQQKSFIDQLASAARRLLNYMDVDLEETAFFRLYDAEVIDLAPDVAFILVVPPPETVCSVPGAREIFRCGDLLSLPIQVFEMIHLNTYQEALVKRYSRLSCILELDTAQAQHSHREAFSSSEVTVAKDRLSKLQDLQTQVNSVWKSARWLVDVIAFARDRNPPQCGINVRHLISIERNKSNGSLKRSLMLLPPRDPKLVKSSPGRGSWPGLTSSTNLTTELSKSEQQLPAGGHVYSSSVPNRKMGPGIETSHHQSAHFPPTPHRLARLPPSKSEDTLMQTKLGRLPVSRSVLSTSSLTNVRLRTTSESTDENSAPNLTTPVKSAMKHKSSGKSTASVAAVATTSANDVQTIDTDSVLMPAPQLPGILQVFAAYETGLAAGTSLKLHVTPRTTAREVVDLVVKQINMAVVLKGLEGPVYKTEEFTNFCLVAVIGARERCLRDDFKPLRLQNPWKQGRLYVRQKQDKLAALEHSSKHTTYL